MSNGDQILERGADMNFFEELQQLAGNDLLNLSPKLFEFDPRSQPVNLTSKVLSHEPLSLIIGEHPSEKSLSPQMWNVEFQARHSGGIFLPFDIPIDRQDDLSTLLTLAVRVGSQHFRVLTITNPYKVRAYEYFIKLQKNQPDKILISDDARHIGATNQILIDQDNVFHVINSDGLGMAKAVENFFGKSLAGCKIGVLGAGGAGRGIIYELAKRVAKGKGGQLTVFNRTLENALELTREFQNFFPELELVAKPLTELAGLANQQDLLVSSITIGDPLLDYQVYETLPSKMLLVDANHGANSVYAKNAAMARRTDLRIYDGSGMVVEGYIFPSNKLAQLWHYRVAPEIYHYIAQMLGYNLKK